MKTEIFGVKFVTEKKILGDAVITMSRRTAIAWISGRLFKWDGKEFVEVET